MAISIRFACGHESALSDSFMTSPVCQCGERQITYVRPSRAPRFTGTCSGPFATMTPMEPGVVDVAPAGPLSLKKESS